VLQKRTINEEATARMALRESASEAGLLVDLSQVCDLGQRDVSAGILVYPINRSINRSASKLLDLIACYNNRAEPSDHARLLPTLTLTGLNYVGLHAIAAVSGD
jgi:hypothetical protein